MKENPLHPGEQLINLLETGSSICSIGVFDALSASIAAGYPKVQALFISGLGFTYSRYGWPDIGLIELTDIRHACRIIRHNNPRCLVISDIDSGFGGIEQLRHACAELRQLGVAAVQLEDQALDHKRCGHLDGKVVRSIEESVMHLKAAIEAAAPMQVIARTDAPLEGGEALRRIDAFIEAGARIVLVDGINEADLVQVADHTARRAFVMANVVGGGKLAGKSASAFHEMGVSIINLSTPLLFPAIHAMNETMQDLVSHDFTVSKNTVGPALLEVNEMMSENYRNFIGSPRVFQYD